MTSDVPPPPGGEEQLAYARLLGVGSIVCLAVLTATFAVYVAGLRAPHVPVDDLPTLWKLPCRDYVRVTRVEPGWGWMRRAGDGDYLNLVGVVLLAMVTPLCYLRIIPILLRRGDRACAAIAAATILVIALAASGLLTAGH